MKLKWTVFLSISNTPASRVLQRVGGRTPSKTRLLIERALRSGKIDDESYRTRMDMLEELIQAWQDCHYEPGYHDPRDWDSVPGGFMRKNHLGGA